MKTKINFYSILTAMFLLAVMIGCTPCYYAPNAHNVPMLKEKGEGTGTFSAQFGPLTTGFNVQGALAVSNHIGIMGNYNHYSDRSNNGTEGDEEDGTRSKSNMGEIGVGYFHAFHDKFVVEAYAGAGGSRINTDYDDYWYGSGTSSMGTTTFFVQPSIGLYKKNVALAFSTRFRTLSFRDPEFSSTLDEYTKEDMRNLDIHNAFAFIEPAITFRAGGKTVKFQAQVGWSVLLGESYLFEYDPMNINFGIVFCLKAKEKSEVK